MKLLFIGILAFLSLLSSSHAGFGSEKRCMDSNGSLYAVPYYNCGRNPDCSAPRPELICLSGECALLGKMLLFSNRIEDMWAETIDTTSSKIAEAAESIASLMINKGNEKRYNLTLTLYAYDGALLVCSDRKGYFYQGN